MVGWQSMRRKEYLQFAADSLSPYFSLRSILWTQQEKEVEEIKVIREGPPPLGRILNIWILVLL